MSNYQIKGAKKLSGSITTNTSKNAAVVLLFAALLNRATTTLKGIPRIEEVNRIIEVLESIGVAVVWRDEHTVTITPPKQFNLSKVNREAAMKTRSVLFLLGTIIHFQKKFSMPLPAGCKLGSRTITPHVYALEAFGVKIKQEKDNYVVAVGTLKPQANLVLAEAGDTVTENAILAAALLPGETVIKFVSANYQVQELCFFLEKFGVKITGIGTTTLRVKGVKAMDKAVSYTLAEDPIETMLFLAIAATTGSAITIKRCPIDFLELELLKLEKMGFKYTRSKSYKAHNGKTVLIDITTKSSKLIALKEKIAAQPYPGLNIDNLPFFVPIATQAEGETFIFDWVYENRAIYYTELNKLGGQVKMEDPHRVYVTGPTKLHATEIICPPALRPATIIMVAMLAAQGTSLLRNVYSIERGYENLCERLSVLGAEIKKID